MHEKTYAPITVVNEADEIEGYMDLLEAIKQQKLRRVSCVLIFNERGDILLQRRSAHVLSPHLLDYSAAGHVEKGDSYESAAYRELEEELRLNQVTLTLITPPFKTSEFYSAVYKCVLESSIAINPNEEEVAEVFWMPFGEFKKNIEAPDATNTYSLSIVEAWPYIVNHISV